MKKGIHNILQKLSSLTPKQIALFCILAGSILRLIFPYDIEYKADQILMLDWIHEFKNYGHFREIGMMSGGNVYNFGLGVWIFYLLGYIADTPVGLTMLIAFINVIALFVFYYFVDKKVEAENKELWFLSIALLSVSIIPIIISRNIWIQSVLPIFSVTIWMFYWSDISKFSNAFFLSLLLVLIGQIHLSGLFLFIAFSTILLYLYIKKYRQIHVPGYLIGIAIGIIPMIPLFIYLINHPQINPSSGFGNLIDVRILWFHIFDGLGLDIFYTLESDTFMFFKYPRWFDHYTYINGFLYFLLLLISIAGIVFFTQSLIKKQIAFASWTKSRTAQFLISCFLTYLLMYLLKVRIYSHYFVITYPFIQLLAIGLFRRKYKWVYGLILINLLLSIHFMVFIHNTGGTANSYYGWTYKKLMKK